MLKGHIWVCDVCLQEKVCNGFPANWFLLLIIPSSYFHNKKQSLPLNKDCCSEKCLRATLRTYLEG